MKPYMDPYLAGVGIGLVLLASYVFAGHGLGASGAFASLVEAQWRDWFVLEVAGVALGGWLSAFLAGRARVATERGPRINSATRLSAAIAGGVLMGIGARFARGCTSGQALTGGALLSVGSWLFIATCFMTGYLLAPAARRLWR